MSEESQLNQILRMLVENQQQAREESRKATAAMVDLLSKIQAGAPPARKKTTHTKGTIHSVAPTNSANKNLNNSLR